jgi:hypothetical protein
MQIHAQLVIALPITVQTQEKIFIGQCQVVKSLWQIITFKPLSKAGSMKLKILMPQRCRISNSQQMGK